MSCRFSCWPTTSRSAAAATSTSRATWPSPSPSSRGMLSRMADNPCIYMVGMNIPADATAEDLKAFNDFYSNTHVPEVVTNNAGFLSGTRYELVDRALKGPRFLAVYEVATEADAQAHINRTGQPSG